MKTIYQLSKQHKLLKKEEQELHFNKFNQLIKLLNKYDLPYSPEAITKLKKHTNSNERVILHQGLKSKDLLILTNQGQVVKLATRYDNKLLDREELIQIGNLGLCKALLKFKPAKNTKFSSYAFFWIRAMMLEALGKLDPIYLPPQARKDLKNAFKYLAADEETTKELVYSEDTSIVDKVFLEANEKDTKVLELGLNLFENHGQLALALYLGCSVEDAERTKVETIEKVKTTLYS